MPGFLTHYFFGVSTCNQLTLPRTQKIISHSKGAYSLGLQGPDVFFYFLPSYLLHHMNLGVLAHENKTGEFYRHLIESRNLFVSSRARHIAEAYILGFMGHYCLDTTCHPYVYGRTRFSNKSQEYSSRHMTLETDIDKEILAKNTGLLPSQFREADTIRMSSLEKSVVATILHYTFSKTYPDYRNSLPMMLASVGSMRLGLDLLRDSTGRKKRRVRLLEKNLTVFACISPMISSDTITYYQDPCNTKQKTWTSPFTPYEVRNQSMYQLMDQAQEVYLSILSAADALYSHSPNHLDPVKEKFLLDLIGNKSYHSGLPLLP